MSYDKLNQFVEYLRKLQEADLDVIIACSAAKGMGKSTLSMQITKRYVAKYFGENYFSVEKYTAYDNGEVMEKIYNLPEFSPIIADEAARFAMGEDWNKTENKELKKLAAQIRPKHMILFLNIPRFSWMDKKYANDMVTLWVRVITRGHVVVFTPDLSEVKDPWHLKEMYELMGTYSYFTPLEKVLNKIHKHACYFDDFPFPPIEAEIYERYLFLRNKKAFEDGADNYVDQKEIAKIMIWNLKKRYTEFTGAVYDGRLAFPSFKVMAKELCRNPMTKKQTLTQGTLRNWYDEIERKMPVQIEPSSE